MPVDEVTEREINQVFSERGYLVIGSVNKYALGTRIETWFHRNNVQHHPLTVVAETDRQDFLDQGALLWPDLILTVRSHYYRCITD